MRLAIILALTVAACTPVEPEPKTVCTTHSIEETGGGLTECFEVPGG